MRVWTGMERLPITSLDTESFFLRRGDVDQPLERLGVGGEVGGRDRVVEVYDRADLGFLKERGVPLFRACGSVGVA